MEEMKDEDEERDRWSERAAILARVLDWVDQRNFEDHGSWMMLGSMGSAQVQIGDEPPFVDVYQKDHPELEPIQKALVDLDTELGRYHAAKRTSLHPPRINVPRLLGPLLGKELEGVEPPELGPSEVADDLDAKYSREILTKLEKIVERAALLYPHEVDTSQIHDESFRASFEEAHRCYLYGFNRACAVMCRALLESALKDRCDSRHDIKASLQKGQSPFKVLLGEAKLTNPLPERAEMIKRCGDFAAHNDPKFVTEYESHGKLEVVLCWTRAVLAALYPKES